MSVKKKKKRDEGQVKVKGDKKIYNCCKKAGHDLKSCWSFPKKNRKSNSSTTDKCDELKAKLDKLKLKMRNSKFKEKANIIKVDSQKV